MRRFRERLGALPSFIGTICSPLSAQGGCPFGKSEVALVIFPLLILPILSFADEVKLGEPSFSPPPPYTSEGKRDPFVPTDLSEPQRAGTPLERYSLSQLRLTAVLLDEKKGSTAVIEDGSGRGYSVRVGSRVGDRGGEVLSIERDRIQVRERTLDFTGKEREEIFEMKLPPPAAPTSEKSQRKRGN